MIILETISHLITIILQNTIRVIIRIKLVISDYQYQNCYKIQLCLKAIQFNHIHPYVLSSYQKITRGHFTAFFMCNDSLITSTNQQEG